MHVTSERLTLHQLARLLKAMTDHAYAHPEASDVRRVLDAVADEQGIELSGEHIAQINGALHTTKPAGRPETLSKELFRAWGNVVAAAKQEPAELVLMETGGLLVPDPRDQDLDGLAVAELFFLVAHDRFDGRPLLPQPVLACGVSGALIAELMLRELISIDLASHLVHATGRAARTVPGIATVVRHALEATQSAPPATLGHWLTELADSGPMTVRRDLLQAGVLAREVRGRLKKKKTYFVPTGEVVDSIFRVVTRPLQVGRMPTPQCGVLLELAKATRLTITRHAEWFHAHSLAPGATLTEAPGRERVELLLALVRAEVTDLLTRP